MELSALPGSGPSSSRLEGRTEGYRDGKVSIRLASGSVLEVESSESFPLGTPVVLAAGSDGRIQILSKAALDTLADARQSLWEALERILDKPQAAGKIAQALAKDDYAQAAPLLEPSADGKPSSLLSEPARIAPPASASMVDLLSQLEPGKFQARVAGTSWELWSSPELSTPQRFAAKATALPNGGAVWTPTRPTEDSDAPSAPPMPDSVKTDIQGARLLVARLEMPDPPPEVLEDLATYLRKVATRLAVPDEAHPIAAGGFPPESRDPLEASHLPLASTATTASVPTQSKSEAEPGSTAPRDGTSPPAPASSRLDTPTALRALVAWSLDVDPDHPAWNELMGRGRPLPRILEELATRLASHDRDAHAELRGTLERIRANGRMTPQDRAELEEKIQGSLARSDDADSAKPPLAEAARALLGERLGELGRDSLVRGEMVWTRQDTSWHQERIVVHDRRRRGKTERPDHHVAQIRLEPSGAGAIDARLVLDGRNLTVRMEAESQVTADRLRQHLPELRAALDRTGLAVAGLDVAKQTTAPKDGSSKRGSGGRFDVRA